MCSASLKQGSKRSGKYYNIKLIEYGGRFFLHTKSGSAMYVLLLSHIDQDEGEKKKEMMKVNSRERGGGSGW